MCGKLLARPTVCPVHTAVVVIFNRVLTVWEESDIIQKSFMRKISHLKFFSFILILVMLTVTINGVHESAHAAQSHVKSASGRAPHPEISESHQCPCVPLEQHKDLDCCDTCVNCACHAPLTIQQFQLSYNPIILELGTSDTFKHLPEVYLSKFILPQNPA